VLEGIDYRALEGCVIVYEIDAIESNSCLEAGVDEQIDT
jgi:hypothetical protein